MLSLLPDDLESYISAHCTGETNLHTRLREETYALTEKPQMLVGPVEGQLLKILTRLCRPGLVLEIGTFTGCSALYIAEGLGPDGRLITCDIDPEATSIATRYFAESAHGHKIELRLGPALETLSTLSGEIDMAFVDADKEQYPAYWEALVPRVRSGGLIVVDNVLWSGSVLSPDDECSQRIAEMNDIVASDSRVDAVMLSVRDGITVAQKH